MSAVRLPKPPRPAAGPGGCEVAEVSLLLPSDQLDGLERLARRDGLTVGQLLRRQVAELLAAGPRPAPADTPA